MERIWITNGSTSIAPVVNPLAAACHDGYVPNTIYILENPLISKVTELVTTMMKTIVTAAGGDEPEITVEQIDDEVDFDAIISYLQDAIATGEGVDREVAVDVTPGRKFWSIISFQVGISKDVDHLFYIHLETGEYFGQVFPEIPRTAINLIDFTEEI
ncbi:hypothetical protein [Halodesulfurarchaeum sp.]|uniref:hypothetical protein n=1 Tax=Halodesulfurarchaeum sp. TaxID=1980530 RepID=UPI002FC35AA0